jgi:Raf kinase inhibitor-like YbhB/YbcL family protein
MKFIKDSTVRTLLWLMFAATAIAQGTSPSRGTGVGSSLQVMTLTSPAFEDGGEIPARFSLSPAVSPTLEWANVPSGTATFVLIFHDPDAGPGKGVEDYLHWLMFNIPGTVRELSEGVPVATQLPDGSVQVLNRSRNGYIAPGAPAYGPAHHYTFELLALDTKLTLGPDATRAEVLKNTDGHILARGVLVGRFKRSGQP